MYKKYAVLPSWLPSCYLGFSAGLSNVLYRSYYSHLWHVGCLYGSLLCQLVRHLIPWDTGMACCPEVPFTWIIVTSLVSFQLRVRIPTAAWLSLNIFKTLLGDSSDCCMNCSVVIRMATSSPRRMNPHLHAGFFSGMTSWCIDPGSSPPK